MPFKSKAQRRFMYAAEARGDVPKGTAEHWESVTPKNKKLPEKVEKSMPNPSTPKNTFNTVGVNMGSTSFKMNKSPKPPKNTALTGKQSVTVKTPKLKAAPDPFGKPSLFFGKSEEFQGPKHKNLMNLWNFMQGKHKK